ncbi:MAG: lipoprotein [Patescibacteria group bacterium]|nr:lipoprotein [Patescibacteria group bacterium]
MKKIITFLFILGLVFTLSACSQRAEKVKEEGGKVINEANNSDLINKAKDVAEEAEDRLETITDINENTNQGQVQGWQDNRVIDEVVPVDEPVPDESNIIEY